jgi:hypothetical protein
MTPPTDEDDAESSNWHTFLKYLGFLSGKCAVKKPSSSYIALFRPLQDFQSRFILFSGIILAIAAGAPLPIIGVIFARIIDVFPPSEDDVRREIYQLLAVG